MLRIVLTAVAVQVCACTVSTSHGTAPPPDDSGVADASEPTPEYPPGPYGLTAGAVFPDLTLQGYRNGARPFTELHLHDYYDPTGSRGIAGLLLVVDSDYSACDWCKEDGANLVAWNSVIRARGGRVLEAVVPTAADDPQAALDAWVAKFSTSFDVVVDPTRSLLSSPSAPFPQSYVIDPRTMKVSKIIVGFGDPGVIRGCKADADCCQPGGTRPGVDHAGMGSTGTSFCSDHAYVCSTVYPQTCVDPVFDSPVPYLDKLLSARGATPLADAGTD